MLCFAVFGFIIGRLYASLGLRKERKDAIKRSKAVINGQVSEQLAPYFPDFPCDPADVRFIGKPVDYIGFSGISQKDTVDEVLLIEVKTGNSKLSEREKSIQRAVQQGRVRYVQWTK